jgi:hypothetical protein
VQSSAAFFHSIPLMSKYSPQHPILRYPQSVFFPSDPYKTSGKIALYILIFTFLYPFVMYSTCFLYIYIECIWCLCDTCWSKRKEEILVSLF